MEYLNRDYQLGACVTVWLSAKTDRLRPGEIRYGCWRPDQAIAVRVTDCAGGISIEYVESMTTDKTIKERQECGPSNN